VVLFPHCSYLRVLRVSTSYFFSTPDPNRTVSSSFTGNKIISQRRSGAAGKNGR
jgi:hypothetical protein